MNTAPSPKRKAASRRGKRTAPPIDAGWLFLLPGLALLSAAALIPAADELAEARWQRDRAIAMEQSALQRLQKHESLLQAIERGDPMAIQALRYERFGETTPDDALPVRDNRTPSLLDAALVLNPPAEVPFDRPHSVLQTLATGPHSRLWLIAGGAVACLLGFMAPVSAARKARTSDTLQGADDR